MTLYKTNEKLVSENYPYGFRLKTTKTDWIEFDKKHGFRHVSTTINPKTGRENKPKKSTYYDIMLLGRDEIDHVKSKVFQFYDQKDIDSISEFLKNQENFQLFNNDQITYIYMRLVSWIKTSIYAQCQYCGSKFEDLKPLFDEPMRIAIQGYKENGVNNYFNQIVFDWDKINSFKVDGYQPFEVTNYGN